MSTINHQLAMQPSADELVARLSRQELKAKDENSQTALMLLCENDELIVDLKTAHFDSEEFKALIEEDKLATDPSGESALLKLLQCQRPAENHYRLAELLHQEIPIISIFRQTAAQLVYRNYNISLFSAAFQEKLLAQSNVSNFLGNTCAYELLRNEASSAVYLQDARYHVEELIDGNVNVYGESFLGYYLQFRFLQHALLARAPAESLVQLPVSVYRFVAPSVFKRSALSGFSPVLSQQVQLNPAFQQSVHFRIERRSQPVQSFGGLGANHAKHFYKSFEILRQEMRCGLHVQDNENFCAFLQRYHHRLDIPLIFAGELATDTFSHTSQCFLNRDHGASRPPQAGALPGDSEMTRALLDCKKTYWERKDVSYHYFLAKNGYVAWKLEFLFGKRSNYQVFMMYLLENYCRWFSEFYGVSHIQEAASNVKLNHVFRQNLMSVLQELPKQYTKPQNLFFLVLKIRDFKHLSETDKSLLVHRVHTLGGGYVIDKYGFNASELTSREKTKKERPFDFEW